MGKSLSSLSSSKEEPTPTKSQYSNDEPITLSQTTPKDDSTSEFQVHATITPLLKLIGPTRRNREIPCMLSLTSSEVSEEAIEQSRLGLDVICVVDTSGSMQGDKIDLVKRTLHFLLDSLTSNDRMGIVTYNNGAQHYLPLKICSEQAKPEILMLIQDLVAGGGTNIQAGLDIGLEMLAERQYANHLTTLMLLTDGLDNDRSSILTRSIQSVDKFLPRIGECSLHCFGYGKDHDDILLGKLSEKYNGNFYYISNVDDIKDNFAGCLGEFVTIVAKDIQVSLESLPSQPESSITKVYSQSKTCDFTMPTLFAGSTKSMIFMIEICPFENNNDLMNQITPAVAHIRYNAVRQGQMAELDAELVIGISEVMTDDSDIDKEVMIDYYRVQVADVLEEATNKANQNQFEEAKQLVVNLRNDLQESPVKDEERTKFLLKELSEKIGQFDQTSWNSGGRAAVQHAFRAHREQVCTISTAYYQNQGQERFRAKADFY